MKTARLIAVLAAVAALASCGGPSARIDGMLTGGPGEEVVVRMLGLNQYKTLDTLKTDASGAYSYKLKLAKGRPEFIYLFHDDAKIASLLLSCGDRVKVVTGTDGTCTIEGSEESVALQEVEKEYSEFLGLMDRLRGEYEVAEDTPEGKNVRAEMSRAYVDYYRKAVTYIMEHPFSMTSIPVLYQTVDEGFPVFSQSTDALHFRKVADSLMTVYPESPYVKALDKEAQRREKELGLNLRIKDADPVGFIDFDLPDVTGKKVKLSEVDAKAVILYFWAATDEMKMFNLDELLPIYEEFHPRGLEIFAVSMDVDKTDWATVVRNQNLPWINVCDIRGDQSPLIGYYGITGLPRMVIISGNEVVSGDGITDGASLKRFLSGILK